MIFTIAQQIKVYLIDFVKKGGISYLRYLGEILKSLQIFECVLKVLGGDRELIEENLGEFKAIHDVCLD